jgi:hypothetical protein
MSADLNFEAEPYGGFSGSHGEEEFESVMVRDHRGGGAPVVSGQRGGYPGGTVVRDHRGVSGGGTYGGVFGGQRAGYPGGTVVRDHRYGGTTVSVRPAASTTSLWRPGWVGEAGDVEEIGDGGGADPGGDAGELTARQAATGARDIISPERPTSVRSLPEQGVTIPTARVTGPVTRHGRGWRKADTRPDMQLLRP